MFKLADGTVVSAERLLALPEETIEDEEVGYIESPYLSGVTGVSSASGFDPTSHSEVKAWVLEQFVREGIQSFTNLTYKIVEEEIPEYKRELLGTAWSDTNKAVFLAFTEWEEEKVSGITPETAVQIGSEIIEYVQGTLIPGLELSDEGKYELLSLGELFVVEFKEQLLS